MVRSPQTLHSVAEPDLRHKENASPPLYLSLTAEPSSELTIVLEKYLLSRVFQRKWDLSCKITQLYDF